MPLPLPIAVDCDIGQVLDALQRGHVPYEVPAGVGEDPPLPPPGEKVWYGTPLGDSHATHNFGIAWNPGEATLDQAQVAGEALEQAWEVLVTDGGWPQPVSSENYLIWVILDPYLGAEGATVELESPDFAQGYPLIYLDPNGSVDDDHYRSTAAHVFHHALQYKLRDTWTDVDEEAWYWEASAVWAEELVDPERDSYARHAAAYADRPELTYSSRAYDHDHGMFVINAYLEEHLTGPGGMLAVWQRARDWPMDAWDELLAESTGVEPEALWGGLAAAYASGGLADSALYPAPALVGTAYAGADGDVPYLGTHYYQYAGAPAGVTVIPLVPYDDAVLGGPSGVGQTILVQDGDVFGVTGLTEGGVLYQLALGEPPPTVGDDTGDTLPPAGVGPGTTVKQVSGQRCGCEHGRVAVGWALILALLGVRRR